MWPKVGEYVQGRRAFPGAPNRSTPSHFGLNLANPPADEAPDANAIGKEVVLLHSSADFAKQNKSAIESWVKKHDLDPSAAEYATWDFLDFATARTWSDLASLDEAKSVGWTEECDTWEQGFKAVFDAMRRDKMIPQLGDDL